MSYQKMNIYIPSRSRSERSLTLEYLTPVGEKQCWPGAQIFLVVPTKQVKDYRQLAAKHGVQILGCKLDGISATRQFIGQRASDKFLMLDDDLKFFNRPSFIEQQPNTTAKLFKNGYLDMRQMLLMVEQKLDTYVHVAIGARAGNQNLKLPFTECNRPLRALAYRRGPFLACEHGRVAIMEDFDITMQLLKKGHKNCIITAYAQDQIFTQMAGGCSDYRTHELHEKNVRKMVALHAPFVVERQKENIHGGDFGKRTEATFYWKKAWSSAQKEWL